VTLLLRDAPLIFILGVVTRSTGLAMVLSHNAWSGDVVIDDGHVRERRGMQRFCN
jgi:hypothetical protein